MADRSQWLVTTHDWAADLDLGHLEDVRQRFTGGEDLGGRRHLILEVLAYANDEAESLGRTGRVQIRDGGNGWVAVTDDGRGTDTRYDENGKPIRKPVMSTRDVRFCDNPQAPLLPDGLPRRGMSLVSALSEELVHENRRAHGAWSQTYRFGIPDAELQPLEAVGEPAIGTAVHFKAQAFEPASLEPGDLTAFPWLTITCSDSFIQP